MKTKTIYCTQTYWRAGHELVPAPPDRHSSHAKALREGEALAKRAPGVLVFSLEGNPDVDHWEDPVVLARHGETPSINRYC